MTRELFNQGGVAVITGAASGIGRAAAHAFAQQGMKLCLFDMDEAKLTALSSELATEVHVITGDVSRVEDIASLHDEAYARFGSVAILMNNAGIGTRTEVNGPLADWHRVIDVNLWGIINGCHKFAPSMLAQGTRAAIINTGSKQGITNPPGSPAYAISKAGVKIMTEQLAYSLREASKLVTAHLLVPGWTFTGMSHAPDGEKPEGAWSSQQVVDYMIAGVTAGDFYIICPDNAVSAKMDQRRIRWGAEDLTQNRPALSRWHPDWKERFEAFLTDES